MDFGTAIIGAVMFALCLIFVLFIRNNSKKRKMLLLQALNEVAAAHQAKVSRYEFSGNTMLGLDETANVLVFVKQGKLGLISRIIRLQDIRNCKLVKVNKSVPHQGGSYTMLEKLDLQFVPADTKAPDLYLTFYNEVEDQSLSNELEFMDKWVTIINARLKAK